MKKANTYPVVIVHGFLCFGDQELLNDICPCFGMWNGDARKTILDLGVDCYCPSVGPFSSAWDRACVLYTRIKGGKVDYGKVHSEKYGHERYGETYKGLIPDWGTLSNEKKLKKINLIVHSFGAPTGRLFVELLENGSEEEKAGTPENELSDLFKGGKIGWIHSFTSLAGTNNGVSLPEAAGPKLMNAGQKLFFYLGATLGQTKFSRLYGFHLEQFGISDPKGSFLPFKAMKNRKDKVNHLVSLKEDNIFYELSLTGGQALEKNFTAHDDIYYLSYYGCRTNSLPVFHKLQFPTKKMWLPLTVFSLFECFYKNTKDSSSPFAGPEWRPNDGLVNIESAKHPINEPFEDYSSKQNCKRGIWYVMPQEDKDHTSYMGIGEKPDDYAAFFEGIVDIVTDLPD